ncbi:hypothetical protein [Candidatus Villigracilis saccharophilus]|uniref:hypothetical protein n=1 Tax=Candidatus Villigracilis saccharophilus TaxID=3140684 RepID=UPI003134AAA4|nr:hypothetical protein [Anaerolineales bacterium]
MLPNKICRVWFYTFGDKTNVIPCGYLGDPTKIRLVHGGSRSIPCVPSAWRRCPLAFQSSGGPHYDYGHTGIKSGRLISNLNRRALILQSMGPGEAFNLEIENGAGGGQIRRRRILFHRHCPSLFWRDVGLLARVRYPAA